jgi:CubicO group peptidase (beta-lactamase class C family)
LLSHTSGVTEYTCIIQALKLNRRVDLTLEELIDLFKDKPLDFEPGTKHQYSNSGYILLGALIENSSGMSYGSFIEKRIFEPLGMTHSCFGVARRIIKNRASGYCNDGSGPYNANAISLYNPYSAGSLLSTVSDMALWNFARYSDELVPQSLLKQAWTVKDDGDPNDLLYGWGFMLSKYKNRRMIGGGGCIDGFTCMDFQVRDDKIYVILLTNQNTIPTIPIAFKIAAIAMDEPVIMPPEIPLTDEQLASYTGEYEFEDWHLRTITSEDGTLHSQRKNDEKHPLTSIGDNRFIFDEDLMHELVFEKDDSGQATTVFCQAREGLYGKSPVAKRRN